MICLFLALSYCLSFFTKMDLLWRLLYLNYNLVILEKTVKSLVCLCMNSVSLIQIFAICVGVYLTTSPLQHWLMWLLCDKLSLFYLFGFKNVWVIYPSTTLYHLICSWSWGTLKTAVSIIIYLLVWFVLTVSTLPASIDVVDLEKSKSTV